MSTSETKPVFRDLAGDDPEPEVTEIESFCMNCHANGMTRLLLTRIPYYKNVVIMSFSCEACGYENNEIQPGGAFAELGVRWKLRVECLMDLNRQVVKSDYTGVRIPELDFEIPAQSQKGEVTTVEGIIARAISGLQQDQVARRQEHPDDAATIDAFITRLQDLKTVTTPWTLELEDISGNCFVENPEAPAKDPRCERTDFTRSKEQNHTLGIFQQEEIHGITNGLAQSKIEAEADFYEKMASEEVMQFKTNCPDCNAPAETNMKLTSIPHFKQVVIMATVCDACGHRTNEVKSGGGIEEKGVKFEVRVASRDDFSRDILKSETCSMSIPELDFEVGGRALGGRFSTPEGLLQAAAQQLREAPGLMGDAPGLAQDKLSGFLDKLEEVLEGKRAITLVLDDPAGNSYVQCLSDDPQLPDDGLKVTHYERSYEQNDELGLNDMKTEGYDEET
ncbi:PREDICTED: zinc finger protein ZPR1 [Papilio xuthus]|uniref:Zinc finger protein ZPR1 n=1 Tax=Papilio xuthus TaxID=66420 RepID=A0AAJ6ZTI4_PAPXU|nr:PREDICTED: zinc finger protein ZPR1 [Papilio xuthus]